MQTEHARVLKSNWNMGNIEITADFGQAINRPFFQNNVNGVKHFEFNLKQNTSVNISFNNSVMMGYHEYSYTDNSFEGTARASYTNCSFPVRNELDGFIQLSGNSINKSGISFIEIENAVFSDLKQTVGLIHNLQIPSVHYLPIYSNRGLKKKFFKIGNSARGGNPIGPERFILNFPEEAESVITKVTWLLPQGRLTSANNASFRLEDLNGNNVFASVGGVLSQGYNDVDDVYIKVKDLPEGKLVLRGFNANQTAPEFFCLIEYF